MPEPGVVLAAVYEGGGQPISLGTAASHLVREGLAPACVDAFVEGPPTDQLLASTTLLAVSVPLFQSVAPAVQLASRCREVNPGCTIVMFGQHANIQRERLLGTYCDYVIRGDSEPGLVALARRADAQALTSLGVCSLERSAPVYIHRAALLPPARRLLPDLSRYRYPELEFVWSSEGPVPTAGNIEAARGCHHACTYCSVFAATGRKVTLLSPDAVVEDIRQVVALGAGHIWFTDAEFFNGPHHGLGIVRRMKREFPQLTFDVTTRADHLLEFKDATKELCDLGCAFVTTALEFPSQQTLDGVQKELTLEQIDRAVDYCRDIGLRLNPTFIPFNPWVGFEELVDFRHWVERAGLTESINPIQYETRLYLYKGSPLLDHPDIKRLKLLEREFHYEWEHPDPRVDEVWAEIAQIAPSGSFRRCCIKC